jgi:hypothetical protein
MATCGYLCPVCEGKGFKDDGSDCDWCQVQKQVLSADKEEWIKKVHEGPCCSDFEEKKEKQENEH